MTVRYSSMLSTNRENFWTGNRPKDSIEYFCHTISVRIEIRLLTNIRLDHYQHWLNTMTVHGTNVKLQSYTICCWKDYHRQKENLAAIVRAIDSCRKRRSHTSEYHDPNVGRECVRSSYNSNSNKTVESQPWPKMKFWSVIYQELITKNSNLRRKQEIMSNYNKNFRTNYSHKIRIIQL